jgi:hypothetical protein
VEGQLEYEFDDPPHIQDPAEDNEVPMVPFVPDEEEYIAGFPVDDDHVPPLPKILINRVYMILVLRMQAQGILLMMMCQIMMRQLNLTYNLPVQVAQIEQAQGLF